MKSIAAYSAACSLQASVTMAEKLLASLSWRVPILRFSFSQPNMRSLILRWRYFGRSKSRGKPGRGLRGIVRNGITGCVR